MYGACSSMAERVTVDDDVEGSKPFRHPEEPPIWEALFDLLHKNTATDFTNDLG